MHVRVHYTGSSATLLSKLCLGCSELYERSKTLLAEGLGNQFLRLSRALVDYLSCKAVLYRALSFKYAAVDAFHACAYGESVAILKRACELMLDSRRLCGSLSANENHHVSAHFEWERARLAKLYRYTRKHELEHVCVSCVSM